MRANRRLPLERLTPWLLDLPPVMPGEPVPCLEPATIFGNNNPVEIEVGFGKGLFLITTAAQRPHHNFLGIEIEQKCRLIAATRFARRGGFANVKLVCADAKSFLHTRIGSATIAVVHVYFPDPWWKSKHKKRRVFTEAFAQDCARILRLGGRLSIATDVEEYFGVMTTLVERMPEFQRLPDDLAFGAGSTEPYLTNFQKKAIEQGRAIHKAIYERINPPAPHDTPAPPART